jgi:multidrug resistance efflux pump
MTNKPANDPRRLDDPDDKEDARMAARRAKIKRAAAAYSGRTDLFELGIAICRELREAQGALTAAKGKSPELMNLVNAKSEDFAAVEEAMDEGTKDKLWAALAADQS